MGTGAVAHQEREFRPFVEAREFARNLGLIQSEWETYSKGELPEIGIRPKDIPSNPDTTYKGRGWTSWTDWLGPRWRPFEEAREFVRNLGLKHTSEWGKYCKGRLPEKGTKPKDIPYHPHQVYEDKGWRGMRDWLGSGWRPFEEAREFVRSLGLRRHEDWIKYCKGELPEKGTKPEDIPGTPNYVYKDKGWIGLRDWLGTSRNRRS